MPYDGRLLAAARDELARIREENTAERERRTRLIYRQMPEIEDIDRRMRAQMAQLVRLTISRAPDMKEKLDALKDENLALQKRRAELLGVCGHEADYLDEIFSCPVCKDTGNDGGRVCACLEKLYNKALSYELGSLIRHGDESFERFDLRLYSAQSDPVSGSSPRSHMELVFTACRKFADNFPKVSSNLILQGAPGLGKTFLSACIARRVLDKGCSVCYESASAALDAFEQQKFCRDSAEGEAAGARVRRMLDCDLMILDDLGTEMLTPMSQSALYTLINSRLVAGKKMIISTNLSDEDLEKRYTPQICSRIAGEFLHLPFAGQDIRRIKKGV